MTTSAEPADDLQARWEAAASEPWPRQSGVGHRAVAVAVLAVVVAVALGAVVIWQALRLHHDNQISSDRSSALAAGSRYAAMIATYSYSSFDAYVHQIEAISTPQFAANFRKDSATLSSVLTQYKAGSQGSVAGAGLGSLSSHNATVYVFLDEKVTNSKETGTTQRARMVVTLVRQHGKWLIANAAVE